MLDDQLRTRLLDLLDELERLNQGRNAEELADEPEVIRRMLAVDRRINLLCPPVLDPLPTAYTPLDTAAPET